MNSLPRDPRQNRKKAEFLIRKAALAGADLVQLPETWNTGFFPKEELLSLAERRMEKAESCFPALPKSFIWQSRADPF